MSAEPPAYDLLPAGPLADVEPAIRTMVLRAASPGKHCARNALRHIDKACEIRAIDPDMAAFRSITGEEEAATAIFHALQHHSYVGADKLKPRNHLHKAAVVPFLQAAGDFLSSSAERFGFVFQLRWHEADPKAKLQLLLAPLDPAHTRALLPTPPLHFQANMDDVPYDFSAELQKVISLHKVETIEKHIRARAARRNHLLYATSQGIPNIVAPIDKPLATSRERILACLAVFLFIDQYPSEQLLAQQGLTAFLNLLPRLDPSLLDEAD